jgi:hypothetical protein
MSTIELTMVVYSGGQARRQEVEVEVEVGGGGEGGQGRIVQVRKGRIS